MWKRNVTKHKSICFHQRIPEESKHSFKSTTCDTVSSNIMCHKMSLPSYTVRAPNWKAKKGLCSSLSIKHMQIIEVVT